MNDNWRRPIEPCVLRKRRLAAAREERVRAETAMEQAEATLVTRSRGRRTSVSPPERLAELVGEVNKPPRRRSRHAEKQLERMNGERDLIGPVNLRAEEELAELEGESGRLDGEREDLLQAIAKLRQGVGQLDKEARARLLAASMRSTAISSSCSGVCSGAAMRVAGSGCG